MIPEEMEPDQRVKRRWIVEALHGIPNGGFAEGVEGGSQGIKAGTPHADRSIRLERCVSTYCIALGGLVFVPVTLELEDG